MSQSSVDLRPAPPIRPVLAMLAAHDPAADPRIRWEAESARPYFDVYVLGPVSYTHLTLPTIYSV